MHERARDRDALQFAAGQFARHARRAIAKADGREHVDRLARGRRGIDAGERQRQRDVLRRGQIGQHVERLEDEAHPGATKLRHRVVVEGGEIDSVDRNRSRIGAVESRDEIEQRGFARAGLAHHRDEAAGLEIKVDIAEHGARPRPGKRLGKTADR